MTKSHSALEAVADVETGFADDDVLPHSTEAATKSDNRSISKMSAEGKPGKVASSKARLSCKKADTEPVANGAPEHESSGAVYTHIYSQPATNSEIGAGLLEPEPDASGEDSKQQPVSPSNYHGEPVADAEFIAVVRRKRKDARAKQKTQQSDDLCSFLHRRPARPAYVSPKSNVHHPAGIASTSHMQPASHPGVDLLDSTSSAFPALPSLRVRRSSTGDVPAASESNDDGSDLESVKSLQTSSSRPTTWDRSLGTSSYASVVVGNVSSKESVCTSISQPRTNVVQVSPHSDGGLESSTSCPHNCDPSTSEEVAVHVLPVGVACFSGPLADQLDSSDFMVASSLVHEDRSCTDGKVGRSDRSTHSWSSTRPRVNRRSVLFFDTRSKTSSNPVPSVDVSFGFDDSLTSAAISSGSVIVTDEPRTDSVAPPSLQAGRTTSVEFLQRSSVANTSASSDTSVVSEKKSAFDLRAAQKYLLSGKC